jgi:hypothetical protein
MITDDGIRTIREVANSTEKVDWKSLSSDGDNVGGIICTCGEKLVVLTLTRETALSLVTEILDLRSRVKSVGNHP